MVLQGGPCGRVGHRRTSFVKKPPQCWGGFFSLTTHAPGRATRSSGVGSRILEHMPGDTNDSDTAAADGLLPTLEVIEQQPLAQRAAAYAALLDDLSQRLDSSPQQA